MRKVFDYKDIRRLEELPMNKLIQNGIVITATSTLASAMSKYYPNYKVYDIHEFISKIIPEWDGNVRDIKNYVVLRNIIEDYVNDNEVREEVAAYLRRNAWDMWNAIKLLIEADVYPDDVEPNNSEPIRRFRDIWRMLEIENNQITAFRSTFAYELSQKNVVIEKIKDTVGKLKENFFLFGFYFITPIQDRIFDILEDTGFNLNFFNCHDSRYEYETEIWKKTFSEYDNDSVKDLQEHISLDNYFGEALRGKKEDIPLKITKHYTEFDFAEMVKAAIDKGEIVYSPDAKQCEQILKEYYPEYYEQKHLLSYPVGQYIYYLHMMWNEFANKMDMKFEYVYKCFASGWLNCNELNGRDYLYEMKKLEPYFKFCHDISDWNKRLEKLKESKAVVNSFDEREKGEDRWHRLLGNPFMNMGIYTIENSVIDEITQLINKLIEDAKFLFQKSDKTDLFEHFQKITYIIKNHMDKDELLDEETEIANELLIQLRDETTKGIICPINGIRDAIVLLIGDHFREYETQEEETSNKKRMVLPMSMVEAEMLNNRGQTVHLVLANEFNLPGQPKKLPWPLTDSMIDSLKINERKKAKKYVNDMKSVINNRPLSYRYLYFTFMGISNSENKSELSVGWVCKKENKDIDVSSYIKLLDIDKTKLQDVIAKNDDFKEIINESSVQDRDKTLKFPENSYPEEVKMDFLICSERYIYSYLLNYLPTYTSEFHYSFELSKLISAFTAISGVDKDIVSKNLYELFPFLRQIELRQSTDFAASQGIPEPYEFEEIEYPGQRLLTHYLNNEVIANARAIENEYLNDKEIKSEVTNKICIYCPYSNICIKRHREEVAEYE